MTDPTMDFSEPAEDSGIRVYPKDLVGHLILAWPVEYIAHAPTKIHKPGQQADVVVCDVVILDMLNEAGEPLLVRRSWWRGGRLIRDMRPLVGAPNPSIGFITEQPTSYGVNSRAYEFISAKSDPEAVQKAIAWRRAHPDFVPSQPRGVDTPAPPPDQWARQPQAPVSPAAAPPRQESLLERLARQSTQGAARVSGQQLPPPYEDAPPW